MAAVAAVNNNKTINMNDELVCTPDFPLEPLCEVSVQMFKYKTVSLKVTGTLLIDRCPHIVCIMKKSNWKKLIYNMF